MLYHEHPYDGESLAGRRMVVGEKVLSGDRYASTDGTWKAPGQSVGITIQSENVVWVRPAVTPDFTQLRIANSTVAAK